MTVKIKILWCSILLTLHWASAKIESLQEEIRKSSETDNRGRRDVIEEEKYYNIRENQNEDPPSPWLPPTLPPTLDISIANEAKAAPQYQTTERVTDKPTGRGARASNENWIKLPFPSHDQDQDDVLTPPQPSGELINSRMPRVNFVTQNKQLETSESRNDKDIQRTSRPNDLRTDFVRPGEDERAKQFKPVYPRQAMYYPDEPRYFERYYPREELYSRGAAPYYDSYERRPRVYPVPPVVPPGYGSKMDRYDAPYDNYIPRKPKRIIYYANLPEVVRTPPSVDLRYRYSMDPYRRYDDDYYGRTGRYDYRFRNRPNPYPPYAPLRKEERNYRDLAGAGTAVKDKKADEKVTPTPIVSKKDDYKPSDNIRNLNRNLINSHQYHDGLHITYDEAYKFKDIVEPSDTYLRYDEPLFQGAIDDPYQRQYQ